MAEMFFQIIRNHKLPTVSDRLKIGKDWFRQRTWKPFSFQLEAWEAYLDGCSGLVNAPTGSGKTYSLIVPVLIEYLLHVKGR
jgi:ATP-dependent Lhr-like helicase